MEKLNNELSDDDFERMLQECLDEAIDTEDFLDETDNLDDDTDAKRLDDAVKQFKENAQQKKCKVGERVSPIALSVRILGDHDKRCYRNGSATVRIATTDDEVMPDLDRFKCYVYTEDYYLMCSNIDDCNVQRDDNELTYEMACKHIWLWIMHLCGWISWLMMISPSIVKKLTMFRSVVSTMCWLFVSAV